MRSIPLLAGMLLILTCGRAAAQDLVASCHASSSFDLTVSPSGLLFDRAQPAPYRVELAQGELRTDGRPVHLRAEDQDRLSLFERQLRALLPQVRSVAKQAVDLAVAGLRAEAARLNLSDATRADLQQRLAADAAGLKQRIERSNSTHDWQGQAFEQYANQMIGEIAPLVAGDLGQQALQAAMSGDLQQAAELRDQATDLASQLRPRLVQRMQVLRPQVQALCPAVRQLYELQSDVRDADGRRLDLLTLDS
jgi:hypothetical protein